MAQRCPRSPSCWWSACSSPLWRARSCTSAASSPASRCLPSAYEGDTPGTEPVRVGHGLPGGLRPNPHGAHSSCGLTVPRPLRFPGSKSSSAWDHPWLNSTCWDREQVMWTFCPQAPMPVIRVRSGLPASSRETQHRKMEATAREIQVTPGSVQAVHRALSSWDPAWNAGTRSQGMRRPSRGGSGRGGGWGGHKRIPEEVGRWEGTGQSFPRTSMDESEDQRAFGKTQRS